MNSKCGGLSPRRLMPLLSRGDLHQTSGTLCTSSAASLSSSHTSAQNPTFHCQSASFGHRSAGSSLNTSVRSTALSAPALQTYICPAHPSQPMDQNKQPTRNVPFLSFLALPSNLSARTSNCVFKMVPRHLLASVFSIPSWDMSPWRQGPCLGPHWVPGSQSETCVWQGLHTIHRGVNGHRPSRSTPAKQSSPGSVQSPLGFNEYTETDN